MAATRARALQETSPRPCGGSPWPIDRSQSTRDDEQQVAEQFAAAIHLAALQIVTHPAATRERLYAMLRRFTYLSSIEAGIAPDQAAELRDVVDLSVHATVNRIELSGPPASAMQ